MHGDGGQVGNILLRACPYRRAVGAAPGTPTHRVCDCAGGIPIGGDGIEDPRIAEVCGPCTIPLEIDPSRRSCLYLVPVRLWVDAGLRSGFSCRWFYNLNPKRLPEEAWQCCMGCPHWFPRPPDEADIPRMTDWIRRIVRLYWTPEPARPLPHAVPSPEGRYRLPPASLGEAVSDRIRRFLEVVRARRDRGSPPLPHAEG